MIAAGPSEPMRGYGARWLAPAIAGLVLGALLYAAGALSIDPARAELQVALRMRQADLTALTPGERPARISSLNAASRCCVSLVDANGRTIAGVQLRDGSSAFDGRRFLVGHVDLPGGERVFVAVPDGAPGRQLALVGLGAAIAIFALSWLADAWVRRDRSNRRIVELELACDAIVEGELDADLPSISSDDRGERLAHTMVGRLKDVTDHVSDLRHEYGNSAARVGTFLSSLNIHRGALAPDAQHALENVELERSYLERYIDGLQSLYRAKSGLFPRHPLDLALVADETADLHWGMADTKSITLDATTLESATISGDAKMLSVCIGNLLGNAVKYTPVGGHVEFTCCVEGREAKLVVADSGQGIPLGERKKVFERRYRLANTEHVPGTGLGLHIVENIVTVHGGKIWITDSPHGGAAFHVTFPLKADPSTEDAIGRRPLVKTLRRALRGGGG